MIKKVTEYRNVMKYAHLYVCLCNGHERIARQGHFLHDRHSDLPDRESIGSADR